MRKVFTTAKTGLRLRESPHDGNTIQVLAPNTQLEVISDETWLRVRLPDGQLGYVLSDYVEPVTLESNDKKEIHTFKSDHFTSEKPIRVHREFIEKLKFLEERAKQYNLIIHVTSSLRRPSQLITEAIVEAAKLSNHYAGHAIDFNLAHKGILYNSRKLSAYIISDPNQNSTDPIQNFINDIRNCDNLRWGGDFSSPDPVHIDDALNRSNPELYVNTVNSIWNNMV